MKKSRDFYPQCPEPMIVTLAIEGERDAFTELVRRKQSSTRQLLRRLCAQDSLADDLGQQVFLQVYLKISDIKDINSFGAWLKRVTINVWLQHCRKQDLLTQGESTEDLPSQNSPTAMAVDLDAALKLLSHQERLCVVLSYQEGMSHQEIADNCELPLGTVKSHINRGSTKLKQYLSAYQPQTKGAL